MTFPTSLGAYTSPPPIGYPTRDAVVGDPPAAAVETKSKDGQEASTCCGCKCADIAACLNCFAALFNCCKCFAPS
ncbi:hypothetical protein ISN45_Aa03g024470 [Arabidopsis thaliana x Arabidopsis arenosa]|uniref:Cysteine-rich transmembrane CYSTM domain-containing protein n=1 Tax=Arabidopsis thaliana x Arabidopsis arenosa TaxID=1240361 RepID=A0A8T2AVF6_9BRAS|nr:hypothetical protein ISN45_Aa03g024470 [Arabidopsis thaliana x Arabidopsis arenosa]